MGNTESKASSKLKTCKTSKKTPRVSFLKWLVILPIWGTLGLFLIVAWFSYDLPDARRLEAATRRPSITFIARNGTQFATIGDFYSRPVQANRLPKYISQAFLAIEDRRFYSHFGVDVWGILRAFYHNMKAGSVVQGGSTITQQLAKNFLLAEGLYTYQDRSFRRKMQEVILAVWLECKFTKDQILTLYLNRVYFGAGAFGLEGAAQRYFSKTAKALTLFETAVLAGLLKAPTKYSPAASPEMAEKRAQQVMLAMCDAGFITVRQMKSAQKPTRSLQLVKQSSLVGRYFVDWILEQIPSLIGPIVEDLVVTTTLDLSMQKLAEKEVSQMIDREGSRLNCSQAALLSMTPSGAIRAMVGGKHYYSSQFNRAVQALRPTGSTFKYFIYLAALERGLIPETRVVDTPLQIAQWKPKNYKWESQGQVSMQDGFAYSVNTVSARIARYIGLKHIHNLVHRFGITTRLPNDLTISLGSVDATLLEMTAAYGVMPNEGYAVHPFGIIEIRNSRGKVLYRPPVRNYQRLVSQQNLESMRQLMSAVMQYGTGHHASLQCECWGKSGTTQNHRDAWFIGFTPTLVTGVWTGNDDNQPMKNVTGGKLPGKIWCQFMRNAVDR